jgi:NAD(P)-dependent dehydrogenase (short-subunit alcohol dehydrogenase family)
MTRSSLEGKSVIIIGVGVKPVNFVFRDITTDKQSHTPVFVDGVEYKANIGAAIAYELCQIGAEVQMIGLSEEKLILVQNWIKKDYPEADAKYAVVDINNEQEIDQFIADLPKDKIIYWVQSLGLGGGTVKVKDDNPYLRIEDIPHELIDAELTVLSNTIIFLQKLLPVFKQQKETRIVIISSMSAVRSLPGGSIHNAAKGAISRFANAATIELGKDKIYITDIRPGGIDTGLYDSPIVQKSIEPMASAYGYDWSKENGGIRLAPPSAVGKIVATVLASEAHITSVNLVSRGQFPHEAS